MTPRQLGSYRLRRHLASGGMAEIWLAESAKGIAVIKVILPERARDKTFVQMFLDEARVAATLHHPHIAALYEVGRDGETYFHAIEYVHGQNARAMVERSLFQGTSVPLAVTVGIGCAVAAALHYAHERKGATGEALDIVHRDVTPSNIMVGWDGGVKLVDFGVAQAARRAARTRTGVVKGKLAYMSPEQCRGKKVDRRADVFALGVTLYELSTQRRAFRSGSDYQTMERIVRGDLPRPSALLKDYPPALEDIVLRAIATDVAARYQTAAELGAALAAFRVEHGVDEAKPAIAGFMRRLFGEPKTPEEDAAAAAAAEEAPAEPPAADGPDVEDTGSTAAPADLPAAPPAPVVVMTGPMPVVSAPGLTAAIAVASTTVEKVAPPRPPRPPRPHRGALFAAASAVAVAAAALVFVLITGSHPPATSLAVSTDADADTVPPPPIAAAAPVQPASPIVPARSADAPAEVTLDITSTPAGAIVLLDDQPRGKTPISLRVPRGDSRHTLHVSRPGSVAERRAVVANRDQTVAFTLQRREKPPEPPAVVEPVEPVPDTVGASDDLSQGRY
jgi:serine/threonine-protein kinase